MKYCVDKTLEVLASKGFEISEVVEPSAGSGIFVDYISEKGLPIIAYDILPEDSRTDIIKTDYLEEEIPYVKNRLTIGNPPFGSRLSLAQKFYKKSVETSDYMSFILPISQLNNSSSMYLFDLIHSEDLGLLVFSDSRKVHCCLNIYSRPKNGLNKRNFSKLEDITIVRKDSKKYNSFKYDIRMCNWGNSSAGKILSEEEHYSSEYKIYVNNRVLKERLCEVLNHVNWKEEIKPTSMLKISQQHISNLLKKEIPEIK